MLANCTRLCIGKTLTTRPGERIRGVAILVHGLIRKVVVAKVVVFRIRIQPT